MSLTLDYFIHEDLKLYQDSEHFRFNTDTKLLAQFVRLKNKNVFSILVQTMVLCWCTLISFI